MVIPNISKDISKLFNGICTVKVTESTVDENGIARQKFTDIYEDIPCRLSTKSNSLLSGEVSKGSQEIKLFLLNDISIPTGARFTVTQNGFTRSYKYTGIANIYTYHQELVMEVEQYG